MKNETQGNVRAVCVCKTKGYILQKKEIAMLGFLRSNLFGCISKQEHWFSTQHVTDFSHPGHSEYFVIVSQGVWGCIVILQTFHQSTTRVAGESRLDELQNILQPKSNSHTHLQEQAMK